MYTHNFIIYNMTHVQTMSGHWFLKRVRNVCQSRLKVPLLIPFSKDYSLALKTLSHTHDSGSQSPTVCLPWAILGKLVGTFKILVATWNIVEKTLVGPGQILETGKVPQTF